MPSSYAVAMLPKYVYLHTLSNIRCQGIFEGIAMAMLVQFVTGFWITDPNRTFGILRITNLKYLTHCESLLLGCSHAKLAV